jgi:hypothetical protein
MSWEAVTPHWKSMTIYSFLSQELDLNITADVTYSKEYGNTFEFWLDEQNLLIEEFHHHSYGDKVRVECHKITPLKGDHVIAAHMSGVTLILLSKMGVKVSLLETEVRKLPPEKQTENKKAELIYSLVSLD